VLEASEGIAYDWEPKVNLSAYDVRAPYMTAYQDHFTVFITSKYNCPFTEYFNIILSCDTLYPGGTIITLDYPFYHPKLPLPLIRVMVSRMESGSHPIT
jgi:hypothetical protein